MMRRTLQAGDTITSKGSRSTTSGTSVGDNQYGSDTTGLMRAHYSSVHSSGSTTRHGLGAGLMLQDTPEDTESSLCNFSESLVMSPSSTQVMTSDTDFIASLVSAGPKSPKTISAPTSSATLRKFSASANDSHTMNSNPRLRKTRDADSSTYSSPASPRRNNHHLLRSATVAAAQAHHQQDIVVCRICEEKVSRLQLHAHTKWCEVHCRASAKVADIDDILLRYFTLLERKRIECDDSWICANQRWLQLILDCSSVDHFSRLKEAWKTYHDEIEQHKGSLQDQKLCDILLSLSQHKVRALYRRDQAGAARSRIVNGTSPLAASNVSLTTVPNSSFSLINTANGSVSKTDSSSLENTLTLLPNAAPVKKSPSFNQSAVPTIRDFHLIKKLSRGTVGRVFLARKERTGDYYAVKVVSKRQLMAGNNESHRVKELERILFEKSVLTNLDHPSIVKLYYSFQTIDHLYLVMEFLNGGDLEGLLNSVGRFSDAWAKLYIAETVSAVQYIHSKNIMHRDIKPANLLIDSQGHVKLVDFGAACYLNESDEENSNMATNTGLLYSMHKPLSEDAIRQFEDLLDNVVDNSKVIVQAAQPTEDTVDMDHELDLFEHEAHVVEFSSFSKVSKKESTANDKLPRALSFVGTCDYLAPEVIQGKGYDKMVDYWAIGVSLFQFLTGLVPFDGTTMEMQFTKILTANITWPNQPILSPVTKDLILRLLERNPSQRLGSGGKLVPLYQTLTHLGVNEIRNHEFFNGLSWDNLRQTQVGFVPLVENLEDTRYFGSDEVEELEEVEENFKDNEYLDSFTYTNVAQLKQANEKITASKLDMEQPVSIQIVESNASSFENLGNIVNIPRNILSGSLSINADKTSLSASTDAGPISLHTSSMSSTEVGQQASVHSITHSQKLALVAEDNPIVRKIAQALLESLGFHVRCVENGQQAVEAAMTEAFSIVFMDIMMPELDGVESTRAIRKSATLNFQTPIVAFTALGAGMHGEQANRFLDAGMNDFLQKPFTKNDLFNVLRKWVR